ncbi:MAG: sodium:solute symporter, partial [Sediminibacterium sp.]|nr:sodium:solute symporter [Sediminibacterium sp.]
MVLISIMCTQASAVTFLSGPGQAYTDGMRFVQYYFGLPIAMLVIAFVFLPLYKKNNLISVYGFLEKRFNKKTSLFTSFLFLLSRGVSTGISIYAPAIVLSSILHWDIFYTNIIMGGLLIIYTAKGGAKAVAYTQNVQFSIILISMVICGFYIFYPLPTYFKLKNVIDYAQINHKMNIITTGFTDGYFNWKDKYNLFSGIIGGFFLALSYFGTDQSQVGRYLIGNKLKESQLSLLLNGFIKIPMQMGILFIGILLFCFYQSTNNRIFFNETVEKNALNTNYNAQLLHWKDSFNTTQKNQQEMLRLYFNGDKTLKDSIYKSNEKLKQYQTQYKGIIKNAVPLQENNDSNYIFIHYVLNYLPTGLVGLLIAVLFLAAWGSISAALNSLATCSVIDFHLPYSKNVDLINPANQFKLAQIYTIFWGIFAIFIAQISNKLGSLIEAVNVLGSLFYGVILGIFLVAFFCKKIKGTAVFYA